MSESSSKHAPEVALADIQIVGCGTPAGSNSRWSERVADLQKLLQHRLMRWRDDGMASILRPQPFSAVLALFALGLVAPLVLYVFYLGVDLAEGDRSALRRTLQQKARVITDLVDAELNGMIKTLQAFTLSDRLRDGDLARFHQSVKEALEGTGTTLSIVDGEGLQLMNTGVPWSFPLPAIADMESVQAAIASKQPQISNLVQSTPSGSWAIRAVLPIVQGQSVERVAILQGPTQAVARWIEGEHIPEGWRAAIVDRTYRTVAVSGKNAGSVGQPLSPRPAEELEAPRDRHQDIQSRTGLQTSEWSNPDLDGTPSDGVMVRSKTSGWIVMVQVPSMVVASMLDRYWQRLYLVGALALGLSVALALVFGRALAAPFSTLAAGGRALQQGLEPPFRTSLLREANDAACALRSAMADLARRDLLLKQSEARLTGLIGSAMDAIISVDAQQNIILFNAAAERMFGYDAVDVLGKSFKKLLPERDHVDFDHCCANDACLGRSCIDASGGSSVGDSCPVDRHEADGAMRTLTCSRRSGTEFPAESAISKVVVEGVEYVTVILRDVAARQKVEEANALLAAIVSTSSDAIVSMDPTGAIRTWNRGAESMLGYQSSEVVGRHFCSLVDYHLDRGNWLELALQRSHQMEIETTQQRKDGSIIDVDISVTPMRGSDGEVIGVSAIMRDISERKRREEHMRVVMRELSHRAKNLLAVISAMARNTASRSTTVMDFEQRFSARIRSLAHSHDLLVQQNWAGADLSELIRSQLAPFTEPARGRLEIEGPRVLLKPQAAQMIGLALHELATNASKYGALSVPRGLAAIRWRITTSHETDAALVLSWEESNGPEVLPPTRTGFGQMVTESLIAEMLCGSVDLVFAPEGVRWVLTIPATNVAGDLPSEGRAMTG